MDWYIVTLHLWSGKTHVVCIQACASNWAPKVAMEKMYDDFPMSDDRVQYVGASWYCGKERPIEIN